MDKHKQKTKTDREREKKNKQYRDWQTLTKTNWEIYAAGLNQRIGTVGKYTCSLFKSQYVENSIVVNIIRRMFCDPRACSIEWPSHGKWGSSAERSPLFFQKLHGWLVGWSRFMNDVETSQNNTFAINNRFDYWLTWVSPWFLLGKSHSKILESTLKIWRKGSNTSMPCRDWIPSILQVQMASCTLRFWSQMSTMESRSGEHQADWKTRRQAITFRKGSGYDSNGIQKLPKVLNDIREPYHIFRNKQKQGNKKTTTKKQRHQTKTPVFSILHPGLQHTFVKALGAEAFKPDVCLLSGSWWLFWQRNNSQMCTRYPFLPYSWFSEKWVQPTVVSFYLG